MGSLVYVNYVYKSYIVDAFHKFPEPVAQKLRRALYYTNISLSPQDAMKYYRQALAVADEVGMDPFSDEIIGVKIQVAALLEKIQQFQKAIDVLEIVRNDCLKWIDLYGAKEGKEGDRTRILGKTVGVSVKLGELYANEFVREQEAAEGALVWAVETVLKEKKRREDQGVKPGEGEWMTDEEIGGALECDYAPSNPSPMHSQTRREINPNKLFTALGNHYEERNQHYLAAPLYLQCLSLLPLTDCHSVVLSIPPTPPPLPSFLIKPSLTTTVNNLSISLAQQVPPPTPNIPPISRPALINNARSWANKALTVSSAIKPPQRNEECDEGCAVATHNLGEFAEMDGDVTEARRRYEEARALAKAMGFQEGVERARDALLRVGIE
ncbi:MAG: hypothetical protein M1827_003733 [Pycnora praestabilis]|nr:MAG: hypothetical protein M1827_003733 [Pycnora praestabilis]